MKGVGEFEESVAQEPDAEVLKRRFGMVRNHCGEKVERLK